MVVGSCGEGVVGPGGEGVVGPGGEGVVGPGGWGGDRAAGGLRRGLLARSDRGGSFLQGGRADSRWPVARAFVARNDPGGLFLLEVRVQTDWKVARYLTECDPSVMRTAWTGPVPAGIEAVSIPCPSTMLMVPTRTAGLPAVGSAST